MRELTRNVNLETTPTILEVVYAPLPMAMLGNPIANCCKERYDDVASCAVELTVFLRKTKRLMYHSDISCQNFERTVVS